jgi:hypothetical protein
VSGGVHIKRENDVRNLFWQVNVSILITQRAWTSSILRMSVAISGLDAFVALGRPVVDFGLHRTTTPWREQFNHE